MASTTVTIAEQLIFPLGSSATRFHHVLADIAAIEGRLVEVRLTISGVGTSRVDLVGEDGDRVSRALMNTVGSCRP